MLTAAQAHLTFEQAVRGFAVDLAGKRPKGAPHSAWELLEHMRMAQEDILRFSQSADHVSPPWPEGYWPATPWPAKPSQWSAAVRKFRKDRDELVAMIGDTKQNLYRPFPWGTGQTLLRQAMLTADHNAYHLGQLVLVRKLVEG